MTLAVSAPPATAATAVVETGGCDNTPRWSLAVHAASPASIGDPDLTATAQAAREMVDHLAGVTSCAVRLRVVLFAGTPIPNGDRYDAVLDLEAGDGGWQDTATLTFDYRTTRALPSIELQRFFLLAVARYQFGNGPLMFPIRYTHTDAGQPTDAGNDVYRLDAEQLDALAKGELTLPAPIDATFRFGVRPDQWRALGTPTYPSDILTGIDWPFVGGRFVASVAASRAPLRFRTVVQRVPAQTTVGARDGTGHDFSVRFDPRPGFYRGCVTVTAPEPGFGDSTRCSGVSSANALQMTRRRHGDTVVATLRVAPELRGRRARITWSWPAILPGVGPGWREAGQTVTLKPVMTFRRRAATDLARTNLHVRATSTAFTRSGVRYPAANSDDSSVG